MERARCAKANCSRRLLAEATRTGTHVHSCLSCLFDCFCLPAAPASKSEWDATPAKARAAAARELHEQERQKHAIAVTAARAGVTQPLHWRTACSCTTCKSFKTKVPAGEPIVSSLVELPTWSPRGLRGPHAELHAQLFAFAATAAEQDGCREIDFGDCELSSLAPSISVFLLRKQDGKRLELTQGATVSNTRMCNDEEYNEYTHFGEDATFVWDLRQDTARATPKLHARFEATAHFMQREELPEGLDKSLTFEDKLDEWWCVRSSDLHAAGPRWSEAEIGEAKLELGPASTGNDIYAHLERRLVRGQIAPRSTPPERPKPTYADHYIERNAELFLSALSIRLVPTRKDTHTREEHDSDGGENPYEAPPKRTTKLSTLLNMLQAPSFAGRWV